MFGSVSSNLKLCVWVVGKFKPFVHLLRFKLIKKIFPFKFSSVQASLVIRWLFICEFVYSYCQKWQLSIQNVLFIREFNIGGEKYKKICTANNEGNLYLQIVSIVRHPFDRITLFYIALNVFMYVFLWPDKLIDIILLFTRPLHFFDVFVRVTIKDIFMLHNLRENILKIIDLVFRTIKHGCTTAQLKSNGGPNIFFWIFKCRIL